MSLINEWINEWSTQCLAVLPAISAAFWIDCRRLNRLSLIAVEQRITVIARWIVERACLGHRKEYSYIRGYFVASFPYFNAKCARLALHYSFDLRMQTYIRNRGSVEIYGKFAIAKYPSVDIRIVCYSVWSCVTLNGLRLRVLPLLFIEVAQQIHHDNVSVSLPLSPLTAAAATIYARVHTTQHPSTLPVHYLWSSIRQTRAVSAYCRRLHIAITDIISTRDDHSAVYAVVAYLSVGLSVSHTPLLNENG